MKVTGFAGIRGLRSLSKEGAVEARLPVQVESITRKDSANGKPFLELRARDAGDSFVLRAWGETQTYSDCEKLASGDAVLVEGEFYHHSQFGFDVRKWNISKLDEDGAKKLFEGAEEHRAALEKDYSYIESSVQGIRDPRLRVLAIRFLEEFEERFQRAAAARNFHHARRGGLCAHTAQMMRSASAICSAYPELNRDLLLAGILFHDAGKLWETCPPERGFEISYQLAGEMMGHICISIELVNRLWAGLEAERKEWTALQPDSEHVRLHLLHLIGSHHGEHEFGSPVLPKTPEAVALHFIDNLDAKLEMVRGGYEKSQLLAPGIFERSRPLSQCLVAPLQVFQESSNDPKEPPQSSEQKS